MMNDPLGTKREKTCIGDSVAPMINRASKTSYWTSFVIVFRPPKGLMSYARLAVLGLISSFLSSVEFSRS